MSRLPRILAIALVALTVTLGPAAAWAFTATLSIPGLCAAAAPVLAFSIETMNTGSSSSGGGGGTGKATIKPLTLTKAVDDCTPLLFKAAFQGRHFPTATLQVSSGKASFTIGLTDLLVTDVKHEAAKGQGPADDVLVESITLDGESVTFTSGGVVVTCSPATNTCQ